MAAARSPFELACLGGFHADRLGFAFVAGYEAALFALVPELDRTRPVALCATEAGGGHPRAIRTRIEPAADGFRLFGEKTFVTLGDRASTLLVVATSGVGSEGKARLVVARVEASSAGLTLSTLPPLPFCPEVGHAKIALEDVWVRAEDVLAGDGYDRYLKPFRTVEDVHVHAAVLAHVLGVGARHGWPLALREEIASLLAALAAIAGSDPSAPETHAALAGTLRLARRLLDECEPRWAEVGADAGERWKRDRALLAVAEKVRAARLESAWRALGSPPGLESGT